MFIVALELNWKCRNLIFFIKVIGFIGKQFFFIPVVYERNKLRQRHLHDYLKCLFDSLFLKCFVKMELTITALEIMSE